MKTRPTLELRDVENGLKAGLVKAAEKGWAVTVSVVDDGGHLLGLKRMDGWLRSRGSLHFAREGTHRCAGPAGQRRL